MDEIKWKLKKIIKDQNIKQTLLSIQPRDCMYKHKTETSEM